MFGRALGLLSNDMAIDLGTAVSLVYVRDRGIVLMEPSVVALRKDTNGERKAVAFGEEAKRMLGRVPEAIVAVRPMKDGVIADFDITLMMFRHFIGRVNRRGKLAKPRMIVSVPSEATMVERRAIIESAQLAGAREVFTIEEPIAGAIGAGLPITEPTCSMIVDIGGGTTQVAIISLSGIVFKRSIRVGGDRMDQAIVQHIRRRHNLLIGESKAEALKIQMASALLVDQEMFCDVKGRDLVKGVPKGIRIASNEIHEAIQDILKSIVETVRSALEQMPPELASDVVDRGIVLTGGGALLKNIDALLERETQLPVTIADSPLTSVVTGSGRALDDIHLFRQVLYQ